MFVVHTRLTKRYLTTASTCHCLWHKTCDRYAQQVLRQALRVGKAGQANVRRTPSAQCYILIKERDMKNFDTRVYSIGDFLEWNETNLLDLSPDFQRRGVWSTQAKSYLMDTIISGKPIPKILMTQNLKGTRNKRIIIDGQQRLRTIIEFCTDGFTIYKSHNKEFGGKLYSSLSQSIKSDILKYEIGFDVLFDISYSDTLDIFARLNTYSVKLNTQELLNAEYLGPFKQSAYKIGYQFVNYWEESGILSKQKIARMGEAELASDLLVVAVGEIESNKMIPQYYKTYDEEDKDLTVQKEQVIKALDFIIELYPANDIKQTNFKRIQLFYSLFCAVYHSLYGIKKFKAPRNLKLLNQKDKIRSKLDNFSALYDNEEQGMTDFIDASRRATTDKARRELRAKTLCELISK
jgi:hypothetical protein